MVERGHVGIDSEVILFPGGQVDHVGIYGIGMAGMLLRDRMQVRDTSDPKDKTGYRGPYRTASGTSGSC